MDEHFVIALLLYLLFLSCGGAWASEILQSFVLHLMVMVILRTTRKQEADCLLDGGTPEYPGDWDPVQDSMDLEVFEAKHNKSTSHN